MLINITHDLNEQIFTTENEMKFVDLDAARQLGFRTSRISNYKFYYNLEKIFPQFISDFQFISYFILILLL